MPAISVLMKPSSGMCNMSCDYCFYCNEMEQRKQASFGFMSEETLKNVIRKTMLRAEGSVSYAFQGGEPTLRGLDFYRRAVELEKQYNRTGLQVTNAFQTNGLLLDAEWCRFFHENRFLVGVSVDGTRELHDTNRHLKTGSGSAYEKTLSAIRLLEKYAVDFNILTVINSVTAPHIGEIYRFYQEQGWKFQQYIPCLDPLEPAGAAGLQAVHSAAGHALTPEQFGIFLIRLFELWYRDWKKNRQPYIRTFENYVGMLLGYPPEACDQRGTCGIQNVVEADGSVYPCDFFVIDGYRLGNFNTDRLDGIDRARTAGGFLERSQKISAECKKCPSYTLCRNGCQRMRDYDPVTDTWKNYYCAGYQAFFAACSARLREVAACS